MNGSDEVGASYKNNSVVTIVRKKLFWRTPSEELLHVDFFTKMNRSVRSVYPDPLRSFQCSRYDVEVRVYAAQEVIGGVPPARTREARLGKELHLGSFIVRIMLTK